MLIKLWGYFRLLFIIGRHQEGPRKRGKQGDPENKNATTPTPKQAHQPKFERGGLFASGAIHHHGRITTLVNV
jgi:hypothetical protein